MKDERDDIDTLVADLTDVAPSPEFRAKVMDRLDERPRAFGRQWQMALAAGAVVLAAAVVWFATGGPGQNRNRADLGSGTVSAPRGSLPDIALAAPAPTQAVSQVQSGATEARPRAAARHSRAALQVRHRSNPIVPAIAGVTEESPFALPPIDMPPIGEPMPVAIDPLVIERDDVSPLELGPLVPPETPEIKGDRR